MSSDPPRCAGVLTSRQGRTAIVTLDRPAVRNAVNLEMAYGIGAAVAAAEGDPEIWAIVIAGNGPVFCAGADLKMIAEGGSAVIPHGGFAGITSLRRSKPMIAAVDGPALAGGFEIVLACDMVVASESASFGLPEVRRALFAAAGGVVRLPHRLPRNVATELATTGGTIGAERAHQLGLVNRLVPAGAALDAALELAAEVVSNRPVAVRVALEVCRVSSESGEAAAWERNEAAMEEVQRSEDFREGPVAFLERRAPVWTGR